jgi:hypothetical protein
MPEEIAMSNRCRTVIARNRVNELEEIGSAAKALYARFHRIKRKLPIRKFRQSLLRPGRSVVTGSTRPKNAY